MKRFPALYLSLITLTFSMLAMSFSVVEKDSDSAVLCLTGAEKVFVPNTFTPNNDGVNDVLKFSTGGKRLHTFSVYSRSGAIMFSTQSESQNWDGTYRRGTCPNGVYMWVMVYEDVKGRAVETAGYVTILR